MEEAITLLIIFSVPIWTTIYFIKYIFKNERYDIHIVFDIIVLIIQPLLYVSIFDYAIEVDCCQIKFDNPITFAPSHRLSFYVWVVLYTFFYFLTFYSKRKTSPILEIAIQCVFFIGIALNVLMLIHIGLIGLFGNIPIIFLLIMGLIKRNRDLIKTKNFKTDNVLIRWSWSVLNQKIYKRIPILIILTFPVIIIATSILLLFGQQPDSLIRAFTETYYHGFSQLDYLCDNVNCGGHYLCSVAANGSKKIVKPIRYGERNKAKIICNRQLLLSNAFEELLENKVPKLHKAIRKKYDKVGDSIHENYSVYEKKWISNSLYFLMKPLELIFWLSLYLFYHNPENHIALQYVNWDKKKEILKTINKPNE